ncbi:MAG TPA: hypothetical protein VLA75_01440, partial [Thermoanaerobaculia bacterium]|nr:hypothetical protein [Thermoanaerobaculia bacterium]
MRGGLAALTVAMAAGSVGAGEAWPPYFVGEVVVVDRAEDEAPGPGAVSVLDAEDLERLGAATVA